MRVLALCGRVGRAGLPGALWCASPFPLAALSLRFAWPPPGWGCPPLSRCPCRSSLPWRCALVVFLGLPLPGSSCARASFVSPAWPLAALWWFLPPPLPFCVSRFSSLLLGALVLFFFFFSSPSLPVRPRCLRLSLVSGPGCPGLGPVRCLLCWPSASRLSVRLSLFCAFRLAGGCSPVVAAPPLPPFCLAVFVAAARCCVPCAVLCCVSLGAVLRRAAARCVLRCCAVLCCVVLVGCRCLLRRALWRCPLPWGPVLCGAAFCGVPPCCVCFVVARWCVLLFAALFCAVCVPGYCAVRSLSSPLCAVLCFAVLVRSRCAVRVVRAVAGAWCCGVPWCGAGSGGPWLSAGGVFRCRCPCLAAWSVSLWLVWFAVVPCFPVSCSVVLWCCRVVLCCCALLSCCGAVGACFALLWAVTLCCVVLLVGRAVFLPGGCVCVLWCSFPRAVRSLSSPLCALRCLVVLAVVPCFPVSCAVALCCRVVLCCRALLSFCGAVCVCFALLRPVVRRQFRLRCCWCLVLWRVPVRCGVSLGVLRCGGAALVCRGVLLCCALSCGVLRPVPCPAVPCCPAVLCWLAVLCGCLRCWCLFFLLSSFPLLKTPAAFSCL